MQLFELFDNPSQATMKGSVDNGELQYISSLSDGSKLFVTFTAYDDPAEGQIPKEWSIVFHRAAEGQDDNNFDFGKSGTGNEVEVMSTVVAAIQRFIVRYDPGVLDFTAAKDDTQDKRQFSRASLYKKMVNRLAGKNFQVQITGSDEALHFRLTSRDYDPNEVPETEDGWND